MAQYSVGLTVGRRRDREFGSPRESKITPYGWAGCSSNLHFSRVTP